MRAGKYEYSVTTAKNLVETLKCLLSLVALARTWHNEGLVESVLSKVAEEFKQCITSQYDLMRIVGMKEDGRLPILKVRLNLVFFLFRKYFRCLHTIGYFSIIEQLFIYNFM
ncbi:uncharacterized protein LOC130015154 [Mercurialis annua]|uniref:uncharacterized protein LOC130015154 n=1 Tax=Mercurialis annua TaxID=3986 RepID=UPI0024AD8D3D|nr:uncharacterized protein LOC130015154 [Mercurialis annua]XP_055960771.1 uncharacterized protein LOC130015154 [Mercurialis annua]XP_055960772.1 uncharacterized protein LOC130015154 [Mercurialis annua]XP_055960773.1 uncharacterized protein LOC130015154 [Mercurialis annua]XP_055960774.1 uncharacterized protein LOC130015154 [Mercurialis annua]